MYTSGNVTRKERRYFDGGFFIAPMYMCSADIRFRNGRKTTVHIPELYYNTLGVGQRVKLEIAPQRARFLFGKYLIVY